MGELQTEGAMQERTKVKEGCSRWLEPVGGGWGRGCGVKGWWGSEVRWRRQTFKQRFKNSMRSQRGLLVCTFSLHEESPGQQCTLEWRKSMMEWILEGVGGPLPIALTRKKFFLERYFTDMQSRVNMSQSYFKLVTYSFIICVYHYFFSHNKRIRDNT